MWAEQHQKKNGNENKRCDKDEKSLLFLLIHLLLLLLQELRRIAIEIYGPNIDDSEAKI